MKNLTDEDYEDVLGFNSPGIFEFFLVQGLGRRDLLSQFFCNRPRNFIVHVKQVGQDAVETFAPLSVVRIQST